MNISVIETKAEAVAGILKSLAHPARLLILCQLVEGEKSVGALVTRLQKAQPVISQQLALLRREGLIESRRRGQNVFYALPAGPVRRLLNDLYENFCAE